MGDAIAVVLMEMRGFGTDDFAKFHPGGMLGKKLYLRVSDLFLSNEKPAVPMNAGIREVIVEISRKRVGATAVLDEKNNLAGLITDGDLRRMLEKNFSLDTLRAADIMTTSPKTIHPEQLAIDALDLLRQYDITQLIVATDKEYLGIIHLHDLVREGLI
jgi:arabinose-5-phosphate isomerase